jgi:hypothetical protein
MKPICPYCGYVFDHDAPKGRLYKCVKCREFFNVGEESEKIVKTNENSKEATICSDAISVGHNAPAPECVIEPSVHSSQNVSQEHSLRDIKDVNNVEVKKEPTQRRYGLALSLIVGALSSQMAGGMTPDNPSVATLFILVSGLGSACLGFAGKELTYIRISIAISLLLLVVISFFHASGYWMPFGAPWFDIVAFISFIIAFISTFSHTREHSRIIS